MLGILALINVRTYIMIAAGFSAVLLLFVIFDSSHTFANTVRFFGANCVRVLGPYIVNFITVPITWALTDSFGAIVAGVLWPISGFWVILMVFLIMFSFIAPLFGWTLDWGRIFNMR